MRDLAGLLRDALFVTMALAALGAVTVWGFTRAGMALAGLLPL